MSNLFPHSSEKLHSLLRKAAVCALAGAMLLGAEVQQAQAQAQVKAQWKPKPLADFSLVTSAGAAKCLPKAVGRVKIESFQENQHMRVQIAGLPANIGFDVFLIQVPTAPFGLSWYQGDIRTDWKGYGAADFVGIFDVETFIVAPGIAPAPVVFNELPFPDANVNPKTGPVHTYHLGIWFDSPASAAKAGCPTAETPFNGEHNAGIQAFNTANYPALAGPLRNINP